MAYSHHDSSQTESMFTTTDPSYQIPSDATLRCNPGDDMTLGPDYEAFGRRQSYQAMATSKTDDGDISRARLTTEQHAQLESEFATRYKPNTEYKKELAEKMGLEFAKVNNWFQNRRARAKHEHPQEPRFDLWREEDHQLPAAGFPSTEYDGIPDALPLGLYSSPERASAHPRQLSSTFEFEGPHQMNRPYNTSFTNLGGINDYTHNPASQSEFSDIIGADPVWPAAYDIPLPKMPNPTIIEQDLYGWSPDSFSNSNGQTNGHDFADFAHDNLNLQSQPMYHSTLDGHLVGNPSSQSFVTLSSEGGERPDLITPPQETSPMLNLNQGVFGHRESDSSELAEDLDTIHLQQSHHGVDLYGAPNTTSATNPVSATGLATPEVSPDSTATKLPCTTGSDLASRRRRPKPLALQHDSMRSFSYAGSRTSSPQLRASPSASGKSSPVRRIKSTGNNLNIMAGRIAKPGTHSAQRSPRNYESCFQLVSAPDAHSSTAMNAGVPRISSADSNLFTPSSATLAQQPQASWVDGSSNAVPIAPAWAQNSHDFSPDVHAVASGFGLPPSPAKLGQHPPQSRFVYNCPPQSAPPHLASFFSDASPIMSAEAFNPTDWPTPSVTTPEHYGPDHHMPIPLRPDHALHHSHSGPVNFFDRVPHHSFSNGLPNIGPFQPYQPPFHSTPPAPKELDIKVECGPRVPSSHITQEVKAYTFNHSTPKDFSPATNSKK